MTTGFDNGSPVRHDDEPDTYVPINLPALPDPLNVDTEFEGRPWTAHVARQAMPIGVAALLWGAAQAVHVTPYTWPVGAPALAAVYFVASIAVWTIWGHRNESNRAERRRWARTVIAAGAGWLLWAATFGAGHVSTVLLAAGGSALMLPYWARNAMWTPNGHRSAHVELDELPEPPVMATVEVKDDRTPYALHWEAAVAAPGGPAVGSALIEPEITDQYEQYTAQLVPGKQTTNSLMSAVPLIASAYGMPVSLVSVIPPRDGRLDRAVVRFTKDNPLQVTRYYPSPEQAIDLTGGNIRVLIGWRGDGSPVWWTFYRAGWGAKGGAVFGDTGAGKSELLRSLITSSAYTGLMLPVVGCPQGGASFPMWIQHAPWSAPSGDEIMHQAEGLLQAHITRSKINRLMGRDIHIPTPAEPLLPWFLDELHKMAEHPRGDQFYAIADTLDREGRKTGIRLIVADQDPSVPATFGNRMTLRRSVLSSQCVTFRLGSNVDSMLPGGLIDPTKLPREFPDGTPASGLGVVLGEAQTFRSGMVRNQLALAAAAPQLEVEKSVASRMGAHYLERHARGLAEDAQLAAELAEDDPELVAELVADNPELAAAAERARAELLQRRAEAATAPTAATVLDQPSTAAAQVIRIPGPPVIRLVQPAPESWTCDDKVRDALQRGMTRFGEIAAHAVLPDGKPYSETAVRKSLAKLIASGAAEDGGHGRYRWVA